MIRVLCSFLLVVSGTLSLHAAHAAAGGGASAGCDRAGVTAFKPFDSLAQSQIYFCLKKQGRLDRLERTMRTFFSAEETAHVTALKAAVHAQLLGLLATPQGHAFKAKAQEHAPTYIMDHDVFDPLFGPETMSAMAAFVTEMLK